MNRWLLSTNAKDIAVQYFIFALLSGQVGSMQSFLIRLELSGGSNVYFAGALDQYNVVITGHAIQMIFYLVMPGQIGGFGRRECLTYINYYSLFYSIFYKYFYYSRHYSHKFMYIKERRLSSIIDKSSLSNVDGPYQAGQIEGDGSIVVGDKSKLIRICFNSKDEQQAQHLHKTTGWGKIVYPLGGNRNYLLWEITRYDDQEKIIYLINGHMRTPKLEALHRLIDYLQKHNRSIGVIKMALDRSPITSNSWLSGFTDADGNFNVIINNRKNNKAIRIQTQYRIELRQVYHKTIQDKGYGITYWDIMSIIAYEQGVNVYTRARYYNFSMSYSYFFVAGSSKSKNKLRRYFDNYPLKSSKYEDYLDWCKIIDIAEDKNISNENKLKECQILKNRMNNKRVNFTWSHLN